MGKTVSFSLGTGRISVSIRTDWSQEREPGWAGSTHEIRKYDATVSYEHGSRMHSTYTVGSAHFTDTWEELALGLLRSLAYDAQIELTTVEEFLADFGYGTDSHQGHQVFEKLKVEQAQLKKAFGDDLDAFVRKFYEE